MSLRLIWTAPAGNQLNEILDYIAEDNETAARQLKDRIDRAVVAALEFSYGFRTGRVEGTREIVAHPNYIVVYRVSADSIVVVSVMHTRREYP